MPFPDVWPPTCHDERVHEVYRPWFGRMLTIAIGSICVVAAVTLLWRNGLRQFLQVAPWLALVAGACWAAFWRPRVEVSDGGVRLVNVFRTIDLPWPSIEAINTKWSLGLVTAYGTFTAWAAPAPGVRGTVRAARSDVQRLPPSAVVAGGIRPGDLPSSASGEVAVLIRTQWEALRDAGHLDDPRLERQRAPITWHITIVAAGAGLAILGIVGLLA